MAMEVEPGPEPSGVAAALVLLQALQRGGMDHLVLCPGSRSAPLAAAAGLLERRGLRLYPALDERSAAFFALGLGRALGRPAGVVTTSGSAVANLLPAAVEADTGTIPLLLLTADRPDRLKGCGANQSVNQEAFLRASCRWLGQADGRGLAAMDSAALERFAAEALAHGLGSGAAAEAPSPQPSPDAEGDRWGSDPSANDPLGFNPLGFNPLGCNPSGSNPSGSAGGGADPGGDVRPPGPVHLNLPFEEPLHATGTQLLALEQRLQQGAGPQAPLPAAPSQQLAGSQAAIGVPPLPEAVRLDPDAPGVVVAGPWRGAPQAWAAHVDALRDLQRRSGWPVLADALSGLRGQEGLELVAGYDLILERPPEDLAALQVLRLGSLPASRRLQSWLQASPGVQVLVSEADPRPLDPLGRVRGQWSGGLAAWWRALAPAPGQPAVASQALAGRWQLAEARVQRLLDGPDGCSEAYGSGVGIGLGGGGGGGVGGSVGVGGNGVGDCPSSGVGDGNGVGGMFSEPGLARRLARLLPAGVPLMLANSSPVRDWESFSASAQAPRPLFAFRGASGIDGTLSIAAGLAEALGQLVLISGDLALLHDANGWLWLPRLTGRLTVLVIANDGGGIFEQLPIRTEPADVLDFERLFAMPQAVDPLALAAVHGVPGRHVAGPAALERDLAWALERPCALLRLTTDRSADADRRRRLRTMAARACAQP